MWDGPAGGGLLGGWSDLMGGAGGGGGGRGGWKSKWTRGSDGSDALADPLSPV